MLVDDTAVLDYLCAGKKWRLGRARCRVVTRIQDRVLAHADRDIVRGSIGRIGHVWRDRRRHGHARLGRLLALVSTRHTRCIVLALAEAVVEDGFGRRHEAADIEYLLGSVASH